VGFGATGVERAVSGVGVAFATTGGRSYLLWAFGVDVLTCPRCGGTRRLLAAIQDLDSIERVLRAMGLSFEVPELAPARALPGGEDSERNAWGGGALIDGWLKGWESRLVGFGWFAPQLETAYTQARTWFTLSSGRCEDLVRGGSLRSPTHWVW
jgi:hypothetical protein